MRHHRADLAEVILGQLAELAWGGGQGGEMVKWRTASSLLSQLTMVHATSPSQHHAGALEQGGISVLVIWCYGALVIWCHGALMHWLNGALVKWCDGAPADLVVGLDVVGEVVPGDRLDVLGGAEDGAAQGCALGREGLAYRISMQILFILTLKEAFFLTW